MTWLMFTPLTQCHTEREVYLPNTPKAFPYLCLCIIAHFSSVYS